jgi:hypothetical protein
MDLPDVKAGMAIMAEHIQRLNAAIKQTRVRPGPGYLVKESNGGTSLVINPRLLGSSSAAQPCPFSVTDVSEPKPNGGLTLKIQISQDPVLGTINDTYPQGRYPDGMSGEPDAPAYIMTLSEDAEVVYVYVNVLVDQLAEILPATTAITISVDKEFTQGSSTYQKYLVAIVEKKLDDAGDAYISEIQNLCPVVFAHTAPPCPFLVEDDSRDGVARVTVRSGLVANALPDNMTLNDTFTVTLATTQSFWVIYCGMVVNNGVIQTGPGNITIFASDSYQDNTSTYVYFKLAQLNLSQRANGDWYASYILNTCAVPFVAGGGSACDYFAVTDATEGTDLKVQVAQNLIAGRYPDGMGNGFPPFILQISQSCYIYAAIYWDISTLTIGSDSSAITILQSNDLLQNTGTMQYILIATVTVGGSPEAITSIANVCSQPQPNPCLLDWSS